MGNNSLKQRPLTLPAINNIMPTYRDKKSRIINNMVVNVIKKLDDPSYLENFDKNFIPKMIEIWENPAERQILPNNQSEGLQPFKNAEEDSPIISPMSNFGSVIHRDQESIKNSKSIIQNNTMYDLQKQKDKENKFSNGPVLKNTNGMNSNYPNAPKRSDSQNMKFFLSQNRVLAGKHYSTRATNNSKSKPNNPNNLTTTTTITTSIIDGRSNSLAKNSHSNNPSPRERLSLTPSRLIPMNRNSVNNSNQSQNFVSGHGSRMSPVNIGNFLSPSNILEDNDGANLNGNLVKQCKKKRFYVNCSLEKKFFIMPTEVSFNILTFVLDDYHNLILVSPLWYYKINEVYDSNLVTIDNSFIKSYMSILTFKSSFFSSKLFKVSSQKAGIRMDRNIIAEPLPNLLGKTVTLAYDYQLMNKKGIIYKATYKFDVVKKGNRIIWIYKEECKHNYDETKLALVQPIMPICIHDNIKLSINFYNMHGFLNLSTLRWQDPIVEATPYIPMNIDYNELHMFNRNRICEVEEIHHEWIPYRYFEKKEKEKAELDIFQPYLNLKDTKCAGVDIITMKSLYVANQIGKVTKSLQKLGLHLEIFDQNQDLTTEVKRSGLCIDLDCFLQLRMGDKLIFYLSKGE